jgi:VanZ family protein
MIERSGSRPWYDTPLARWLAVALWMAIIFAFSAQSRLPSAPQPWLDFLFKKSAHFMVFATLAALFWRAFEWRPRAWIWSWLLTVIYAISDEWHQSFVAGRHPQATDVLIDACGAATALLVVWLVQRRTEKLAESVVSSRLSVVDERRTTDY